MAGRMSSEQMFRQLCAFLLPLDSLSQSYRECPANGLKPRFNSCYQCLAVSVREAPPHEWFQYGHCSHCNEVQQVCDPLLADLCISLGLRPTEGENGIPRLRQAFVYTPMIPHTQLLTRLSLDIRRIADTTREDE